MWHACYCIYIYIAVLNMYVLNYVKNCGIKQAVFSLYNIFLFQ
jgi:hypothetical protein